MLIHHGGNKNLDCVLHCALTFCRCLCIQIKCTQTMPLLLPRRSSRIGPTSEHAMKRSPPPVQSTRSFTDASGTDQRRAVC